jgi:PKD repeat protein
VPVSSFTYTTTNLQANFTDTSTNGPTGWAWDFGDTNSSTAQNPSHTYAAAGTYNVCLTASNGTGPGNNACQSVTVAPGSTGGTPVNNSSPDPDPDGDGISGDRDNCPYDYNPDQEDGWGSDMGDLCDTEWYNRTGVGVSGFVQKDGIFHLHGNCIYLADGAPRCPVIGPFDPTQFDPANGAVEISSDDAGNWSVWVFYLHSKNGADVYQVNTYSTNPPQPDTLVDDRLEIHVNGSSWRWYQRGGMKDYHGI